MKSMIFAATAFAAALSLAQPAVADMSRISKGAQAKANVEDMSRISKTEAAEDMSRISKVEDMSLITKA
jgi:hypothetical protein